MTTVDTLRELGWSVAVHNDYRLEGVPHTFWLFTMGDRCVKGEGRTDEDALRAVALAIKYADAERQAKRVLQLAAQQWWMDRETRRCVTRAQPLSAVEETLDHACFLLSRIELEDDMPLRITLSPTERASARITHSPLPAAFLRHVAVAGDDDATSYGTGVRALCGILVEDWPCEPFKEGTVGCPRCKTVWSRT